MMKKDGLIHIYTGDGKGKTTASLGLAIRALGHGWRVLFVQFFKEDSAPSGEKSFLDRVKDQKIELIRSNCRHPMFTGKKTDEEAVRRAVTDTFRLAKERVSGPDCPDLLVLDEIMAAVNGGWIAVDEVAGLLREKPPSLEVVLTGRNAPAELVMLADYVTEMLKIKHPFDRGVRAREGTEY